jgi:hypothetical protein
MVNVCSGEINKFAVCSGKVMKSGWRFSSYRSDRTTWIKHDVDFTVGWAWQYWLGNDEP